MKIRLISLVFILATVDFAQAAQPSDESVEKLLSLLGVDKTPALILGHMDEMTANTVREASMGHRPAGEEEKAIHTFEQKSLAVRSELQERTNYQVLKPGYVATYREVFSQDEIDQLIVFYQTPTGKMLLAKMPQATQLATAMLQQRLTPVFQRMQQAADEMKQQLDTLRAPKPAPQQ